MLESSDLVAFVPATDLRRARAFYEQILGLPVLGHDDFACVLDAHGTMLRVTAVPEVARGGYTVLGWRVADIAAAARELTARGVTFVRYEGKSQDEAGTPARLNASQEFTGSFFGVTPRAPQAPQSS